MSEELEAALLCAALERGKKMIEISDCVYKSSFYEFYYLCRLFNTALKGPGLVILNSMPLPKLQRLFIKPGRGGGDGEVAANAAGAAA